MFGESESESPRVPSPWDSLISLPPSPKPSSSFGGRARTPSPLAAELIHIPRLVPEADDGNVEYKLQLLSPSPARFARLVTQMKWRLLEGGGQAYYELGVADSGDLIGLPREELERSLETLEMMAGEIGASVVVVKEIEVPEGMAEYVSVKGGGRRGKRRGEDEDTDTGSSTAATEETETEASLSDNEGAADLSGTVVLDRDTVFTMDLESDADDADEQVPQSRFAIDLEIASVFKPRPVRTGVHNHHMHVPNGKNKKVKKPKHLIPGNGNGHAPEVQATEIRKTHNRREARDRKREEKRKALTAFAAQSVAEPNSSSITASTADQLVSGLEQMHVTIEEPATLTVPPDDTTPADIGISVEEDDVDGEDDVFASPTTAGPSFTTFSAASNGESFLDVPAAAFATSSGKGTRLIVEALVVRKMSLEEAFLDFGGFSLT